MRWANGRRKPAGIDYSLYQPAYAGRSPFGLLLHFKLGVDDIVLALALAAGSRPAASTSRWRRAMHVLRHRLGRHLQIADGLPNGLGILAAGRLPHSLDRRVNGVLVRGAILSPSSLSCFSIVKIMVSA